MRNSKESAVRMTFDHPCPDIESEIGALCDQAVDLVGELRPRNFIPRDVVPYTLMTSKCGKDCRGYGRVIRRVDLSQFMWGCNTHSWGLLRPGYKRGRKSGCWARLR